MRPKNLRVCDKSGTFITCSATFFLEMGARVSLKVATKESFRDKKTLKTYHTWEDYSKAKTEECD